MALRSNQDDILAYLKEELIPTVSASNRMNKYKFYIICFILIVLVVAVVSLSHSQQSDLSPSWSDDSSPADDSSRRNIPQSCEADNGVVASDDGRCSIVGRNILKEGGHAVDAAVATALCEGVVNPMASGIGGGSFMLIRLTNGSAYAYDMREVAPAAASKDMYARNPSSKADGALSIGVPGEVAGLYLAWKKFGRRPWKSLFPPAVKFARDGFTVSPYLAAKIKNNKAKIKAHKALWNLLSRNGTRLLKAGDVYRNSELARTLELIAEQGPKVFYQGIIGKRLIADIQEAGGIITVKDLRRYRVAVRPPVKANVMGLTVLGMPPPSSGGASLTLILNILSNFGNLSSVPEDLHYHRLVEAFKHAYAVRMKLGDPAFTNITRPLSDMLSSEFAAKLYHAIRDNTTFPPEYYGYGSHYKQLEDHGTCHFGVVDSDRNAVSLTTTMNYAFGSKLLSKSTGIILNNEMDDFSVPTDRPAPEANFVAPNKRPLSSMSPTIVLENGQLRGVLGASGGIRIITGVVQVFLNHFMRGMDPLAAVHSPRVHHQLIPNEVGCENWTTVGGEKVQVPKRIQDSLLQKGHKVTQSTSYCVSQLIVHDLVTPATNHQGRPPVNNTVYFGRLTGISDFRKYGAPAGF